MATRGEYDTKTRFQGCSSISQYQFLSKLGEGTFGEVHKAVSNTTGRIVALKKIRMHDEKNGFPITAIREIKLLKMLSHVNVLRLEEMAVERPKGAGKRKATMYMVTPYMEHDLSGLLENPQVHFTEPQIKCYMLQLLEGLRYLHNCQILHRDMKVANLLINNKGLLQIADFGLARPYDEAPPRRGTGGGEARREYTTLVVTRWYRPPELLLQLRKYTTAIDMWGVGCVFGEMFKRRPILAGKSDLSQIQIIFDLVGSPTEENMPGWSSLPGCDGVKTFTPRPGNLRQTFREYNMSDSALSLLAELLKLDWRKRITAIDALEHPYFKNHPLPARPEDLPTYSDSHELDRRNLRAQRPPAPAGGDVGMGPNGEWAMHANGGAFASGPPSLDRRGAGNAPYRDAAPQPQRREGQESRRALPYDDRGPAQPHDTRRPPGQGPPTHRPSWQQRPDGGPRPPPRDARPVDALPNGARQVAPRSNVDTYIPSYSDGRGPPPRDDRRPPLPRDDRDYRDRDDLRSRDYDRDRPRDRRPPASTDRPPPYEDRPRDLPRRPSFGDRDHRRSRSRSPDPERRDRARDRERDRDRDRDRERDRERERERERDFYRR